MPSIKAVAPRTRNALLGAAYQEIYLHGFQGASLDRMLAAAGVTKGALYHYFPGKKELGYAVLEERIAPLIQNNWRACLTPAPDPLRSLQDVLTRFAAADDGVAALGCPLNNLSQEMSPLDEGFRQRAEQIFSAWRQTVDAALTSAQEQGHIRADLDPAATALFVVASIEGCFSLAKNARSSAVLHSGCESLISYLESLRTTPTTLPSQRTCPMTTEESFRSNWELYSKAGSAVSSAERRQLLEQSVMPDCVYTDPTIQCHGHAEFTAYVEQIQREMPGIAFTTENLQIHHDQALVNWNMVDSGGAVINTGTSFIRFGNDGRLTHMSGFFAVPPSAR